VTKYDPAEETARQLSASAYGLALRMAGEEGPVEPEDVYALAHAELAAATRDAATAAREAVARATRLDVECRIHAANIASNIVSGRLPFLTEDEAVARIIAAAEPLARWMHDGTVPEPPAAAADPGLPGYTWAEDHVAHVPAPMIPGGRSGAPAHATGANP